MENNVKILILKLIKYNGDITPLLKLGYEYNQIVELINDEISQENAIRANGKLQLTEKGDMIISKIVENENRKNLNIFIEPENESKIPKIQLDFIFLPNQNELTFKLNKD